MFEQNWESQCTRAGLAFAQNAVLPPYPHSMLRRQAFARPVNHLFTPGPPINVEFGQLRSACRGSRGHSATLFNIEWGSGGGTLFNIEWGSGGCTFRAEATPARAHCDSNFYIKIIKNNIFFTSRWGHMTKSCTVSNRNFTA